MNNLLVPKHQLLIPQQQITSPLKRHRRMYANDFSVLNPTLWANEAILRLRPKLVLGNLINRNFANDPAKFGDIINAFVPGDFKYARKGAPCEAVVIQDATGASIQVTMDQWPQVAFMICDGEEDREFLDLITTLLEPAIVTLAEGMDRTLAEQVYQFTQNNAGHLGKLSNTNFLDYLTDAFEVLNNNNVPIQGRTMVLTNRTVTQALKNQNLINAAFTGDQSNTFLKNATLGTLLGWQLVGGQTQPSIKGAALFNTAAVNNAAGYPAGATSIVYDTDVPTDGLTVGEWVVIDGDDTPQHITAVDTTGNALTISPGLKTAVADNAVIKAVQSGAVNNASGYLGTTVTPRVIGYNKQILVDGFTNNPPKLGQMVTFGNNPVTAGFGVKYGIVRLDIINAGAGQYGIWLDKPLQAPLADNDIVNLGPLGEYNLGLQPNAFTLVNRPPPRPRVGVLSSVVNDSTFALRVTISYDAEKQGHLVVIDTFFGVGTVDPNVGMVMYG